jgi:lipase
VLAPDLRGHGRSSWEPPWRIDTHLADVVETVGDRRAAWLGHSFGGRLVLELAARRPELVERAILLDPAIQVLPHVAFDLAEEERRDVAYASATAAIEARLASGRVFHTPRALLEEEMRDHLERGRDGLRFRYCKSAVIAAWSELTTAPAPARDVRAPTLLVVGDRSWLLLDEQVEALAAALRGRLETVEVPGGHTVLWDSFEATAGAIDAFLGR